MTLLYRGLYYCESATRAPTPTTRSSISRKKASLTSTTRSLMSTTCPRSDLTTTGLGSPRTASSSVTLSSTASGFLVSNYIEPAPESIFISYQGRNNTTNIPLIPPTRPSPKSRLHPSPHLPQPIHNPHHHPTNKQNTRQTHVHIYPTSSRGMVVVHGSVRSKESGPRREESGLERRAGYWTSVYH